MKPSGAGGLGEIMVSMFFFPACVLCCVCVAHRIVRGERREKSIRLLLVSGPVMFQNFKSFIQGNKYVGMSVYWKAVNIGKKFTNKPYKVRLKQKNNVTFYKFSTRKETMLNLDEIILAEKAQLRKDFSMQRQCK